MTETYEPADQKQRERIERSLDETLFVEASAGTGKTTALVSRVVSLIAGGKATVDQVAAITFTEAAVAELRARVREKLEERAVDSNAPDEASGRCRAAAGAMERGAFQTIHSFAASLLRERPLEAGLPPGFDTSDEITADLEFDRRWRDWLETALDSEDAAPGLARYLRLGLPPSVSRLEEIARAFHANYDLLTEPFESTDAGTPADAVEDIASEQDRIEHLRTLAKNGDDDPLSAHARNVASLCASLEPGPDHDEANARRLIRFGKVSTNIGRQPDWVTDPDTGVNGCKALKALLSDLEESRSSLIGGVALSAVNGLLEELCRFVLDYAEARKREGRAEFHDLLIWARDLLRDDEQARVHFMDRYRYVLIDEFQDTDPIQSEIALLLTGGGAEGRLFIVGDPKQSIYRFRRADIASVKDTRDSLVAGFVPLTQNFRCQEPIVAWVNAIFGEWMGGEPSPLQAEYQDLRASYLPPESMTPVSVHWYGEECERAPEMRRREARATANVLSQIKSGGWQVRDDEGGTRGAEYRDVCVLMPARTALTELEDALSDAGVPYRVESASAVLRTQDVRDLLNCLRAIDSPADEVAIMAALRSSAFACSDADLLAHVDGGGRFSYAARSDGAGPVSEALATLARFHDARTWEPPDLLIERFVRERRMIEAAFDRRRPRERWRRMMFVVERARTFAATAGGGLRDFLDWIDRQAKKRALMVEAPVPETDEDAVRIMTIHAAKGLEFPIVTLVGLGASGGRRSGPVLFDRGAGEAHVRISAQESPPLRTRGYAEAQEAEKLADDAESVRLMYVAATRARDHLVVSAFRYGKSSDSEARKILELAESAPDLWRELHTTPQPAPEQEPPRSAPRTKAEDRDRWLEEREEVVRRASARHAVAASSLAHDPEYDDPDREPSPGRRGRAGTNVGRAVHAVLQAVDLPDGREVSRLSRLHAESEGVSGRTEEVERLARRAIGSDIVRRAVESDSYYREIYAAAPVGESVLEGFVDLCFVEDGALVIVDFKTDAITDQDGASIARRYRTQVGAYALALRQSTGMPVKEAILLFLQRDRIAETFEDIDALMAEAEAATTPASC